MINLNYSTFKISFEVTFFTLYVFFLIYSIKIKQKKLIFLSTVYGYLLELGTVVLTKRYSYGKFYFNVFDIPIIIGLCWGIIIFYSFLLASNSSNSSNSHIVTAATASFYGLLIDLTMDVISIRLKFWDWGNGIHYQYFGVPFGNFIAWVVVVFSFSFFYLKYKDSKFSNLIIPLFSLLIVFLSNGILLINSMLNSFSNLVLLILITTLFLLPKISIRLKNPKQNVIFLIPLTFQIYFLIVGFLSNILLQNLALLFVNLLFLVISLAIHSYQLSDEIAIFVRKIGFSRTYDINLH